MTLFTSSSFRILAGFSLVVFGLAFVSYWPALSAGFVFDDGDFVTGNSAVRSPNGLYEIWTGKGLIQYYPLGLRTACPARASNRAAAGPALPQPMTAIRSRPIDMRSA